MTISYQELLNGFRYLLMKIKSGEIIPEQEQAIQKIVTTTSSCGRIPKSGIPICFCGASAKLNHTFDTYYCYKTGTWLVSDSDLRTRPASATEPCSECGHSFMQHSVIEIPDSYYPHYQDICDVVGCDCGQHIGR